MFYLHYFPKLIKSKKIILVKLSTCIVFFSLWGLMKAESRIQIEIKNQGETFSIVLPSLKNVLSLSL